MIIVRISIKMATLKMTTGKFSSCHFQNNFYIIIFDNLTLNVQKINT